MYVRIYDESSDQFLWVTPSVECCDIEVPSFFYRNTCPPIYPGEVRPGSLWYNNETGKMAVYVYDPESDQYVWTTPSIECCPNNLEASINISSTNCDYSGEGVIYFELSSSINGGFPPYTYNWSFNGNQNEGFSFNGFTNSNVVNIQYDNGSGFLSQTTILVKLKVTDSKGNISFDYYLLSNIQVCNK